MWSEQPLEVLLQEQLCNLSESVRTTLWADYLTARRFVTEEIAGLIPRAEPDLTDHTDRHLADVMGRGYELIGENKTYFAPYELYMLALSILFHDVGNLHGRKEHQKKISGIYETCRKRESRFGTERNAMLAIAGAHAGSAKDGSKDTLRDVDRLSFLGHSIRGQEIAALLRLSDELAEGPQRTSAYLLNHKMYEPSSRIYHKYASISEYCIEPGRIAVTYSIDLEKGKSALEVGDGILLKELLQFTYERISKIDQERRYCKYYCDLLAAFKETGAYFNFYRDGQRLDLEIPPIVISDLLVPGEYNKTIEQIDGRYEISGLVKALEEACGEKI
jgi:hypothetical protein